MKDRHRHTEITAEVAEARYTLFDEAKQHIEDGGYCETRAEMEAIPFVVGILDRLAQEWFVRWQELKVR